MTDSALTAGRHYGMSYILKPGPAKERSELAPEEGLTDRLLVASILRTESGGSSVALIPLDADGIAALSPGDMLMVATVILNAIPDGTNAAHAAREGLAAIRQTVINV